MPTLTTDGATIHYTETGRPQDGTLVLLHGFPLHGGMWAAQLQGLPASWRIIAPDFRGFGRSGETAAPCTMEQLADDTHALVQQLVGPGQIVLAGLSMGGYVALTYARKYPQTLRGLILLDSKAEADSPEGRANRDRMIAIVTEKGSKPIADEMLGKLIPAEAARNRPQLAQDLRDMMENTRPRTIARALAAMRDRPDQTAMLGGIAVPTLVGVGDQDALTPPEVARGMHERIPGSRLRVFTGAGHMSPTEQPAQVNAAIAEFLAAI